MAMFARWISIGLCLSLAIPQSLGFDTCMGTVCIENAEPPSSALLQRKSRVSEKSVFTEVPSAISPSQGSAQREAVGGSESFLHQIVGTDGVLMLSLARDNFVRYNYAQALLQKVGITPTKFVAIDGNEAPRQVLDQGCFLANQSGNTCEPFPPKWDSSNGCVSTVEQAITESHRQALTAALQRENANWTAIFEDDAVPVLPEIGTWDDQLKRSWSQLPEGVGFIRLGWCQEPEDHVEALPRPATEANGTFMWSRTNGTNASRVGGCTTAYMVHKRIIPDLLSIFPCCCALDCCLEWDYFGKHQRAATTLVNLNARGSEEYIQQYGDNRFGVSHGVIMQGWHQLGSTRPILNFGTVE